MITASIVLYKTPMLQIKSILNCIISANCVERLFIIDNSSKICYTYKQIDDLLLKIKGGKTHGN